MYEKLSELMSQRRVTAYQVSKATGIGQASLSDWKRGKSKPKFDKIQKLAKYFDVSVEYFAD